MRAAGEGGVPVPRVCAEGMWRDRAALLLSWCPAYRWPRSWPPRPWRAWPLGVLFGRCQAAIHGRPSPEALRAAERAWIDWAGPGEKALAARLRGTAPREHSLVHLDYHPLNVMTDGERITGVLDWTTRAPVTPRADYARTLTILRLDSGTDSPLGLSVSGYSRRGGGAATGALWGGLRTWRRTTRGPGR